MSSQAASRPKPRTRGFSGCWTCRAKHLKCDEVKPACNRCQKAGRECEGYGVRLNWTSVRLPSSFSKRRSRRGQPTPLFEVSRIQQPPVENPDAEPAPTEPDEQYEGLASNSITVDAETSTAQDVQPALVEDPHHAQATLPFFNDSTPSIHHHDDAQLSADVSPKDSSEKQRQAQMQHGLFTSAGFDSIELDSDMLQLPHIYSVTGIPGQPSDQLGLHTRTSLNKGSSKLRLLDSLPDPRLRSRFIQHFVVFLSEVLVPISGIDNLLRTIFVPIALEGARTSAQECTGATAVFHLICAASAFHLSQLPNESKSSLESAALEHYNLGISHISHNIQSDDRTQCVAILSSFIMALMVEVVTVPTTFWRLHMKGAVEWVNHVEPQVWLKTEAASKVYQMFMGITAFIESQLLLTDRDALWDITYDLSSQPTQYMLDRILGLPEPLFQAVSAMNVLQRQLKMPAGRKNKQNMSHLTDSIDRLELELSLSTPSKLSDSSTNQEDMICHHAYLYYYAMLIHMKRVIRDAPLEDVQDLIEQSLVHMEVFGTSINETFSPLMWTIAIISFDACREKIQQRVLQCLDILREKSQLVVWNNLLEWVQQVWAFRKTEGNENLKWHESWPLSENHRFMML